MSRVNSIGNPETKNNRRVDNSHSPSAGKKLLQAAKLSKTQTNNKSEPTLREIGGLFVQMIGGLPGVVAQGVSRVVGAYVTSFAEAGTGAVTLLHEGVQAVRDKVADWRNPKPEEEKQEEPPSVVNTPIKKKSRHIYDSGPIVRPSQKQHRVRVKSRNNNKPRNTELPESEPDPAYDILKLNDRDLVQTLANRFSTKNATLDTKKVSSMLMGLQSGSSFHSLVGIFSPSHVLKAGNIDPLDLVLKAEDELERILGGFFRDYELAARIVDRLSHVKLGEAPHEEAPTILKFSTGSNNLPDEFKNIPGINEFLGISPVKTLSLDEEEQRKIFLKDLIDIKLMPKSLDLEYKNYLDYAKLKKSKDATYTFYLGRIDQELRRTEDPLVNNFTIRKQLAEVLACHEINNDSVIEFASKVVEIASHKIPGAGKIIEKMHRNINNDSFYGHLVEAKNICDLFNVLEADPNVKEFNIEASRMFHDCDIDAHLEVVDSSDKMKTYFVEIKSSIGTTQKATTQREKLLRNLPESGKLVYLIDNLTEGFIGKLENYTEVAKLKEVVSNNRTEIWLSNGKDVTGKIRKTLGIPVAAAA
jgi:hypothetical protein